MQIRLKVIVFAVNIVSVSYVFSISKLEVFIRYYEKKNIYLERAVGLQGKSIIFGADLSKTICTDMHWSCLAVVKDLQMGDFYATARKGGMVDGPSYWHKIDPKNPKIGWGTSAESWPGLQPYIVKLVASLIVFEKRLSKELKQMKTDDIGLWDIREIEIGKNKHAKKKQGDNFLLKRLAFLSDLMGIGVSRSLK